MYHNNLFLNYFNLQNKIIEKNRKPLALKSLTYRQIMIQKSFVPKTRSNSFDWSYFHTCVTKMLLCNFYQGFIKMLFALWKMSTIYWKNLYLSKKSFFPIIHPTFDPLIGFGLLATFAPRSTRLIYSLFWQNYNSCVTVFAQHFYNYDICAG